MGMPDIRQTYHPDQSANKGNTLRSKFGSEGALKIFPQRISYLSILLIIDKGVCRKAPATSDRLIIAMIMSCVTCVILVAHNYSSTQTIKGRVQLKNLIVVLLRPDPPPLVRP